MCDIPYGHMFDNVWYKYGMDDLSFSSYVLGGYVRYGTSTFGIPYLWTNLHKTIVGFPIQPVYFLYVYLYFVASTTHWIFLACFIAFDF